MKRMLQGLLILAVIFTLSVFVVSCGDDNAGGNGELQGGTLNVYNWGEYISDGFLGSYDTNAEFEKWCAKVHHINVKVNYTTYATNEDMYAKISSGAGNYDIVIPSDYMIQKMAAEGLLEKFDPTTLQNYQYIDGNFKNMFYDPMNEYSVPYSYGVVGIIYNTQLVDKKDYEAQSWSLMWNKKYRNKILQFNNPRDAFGTAMYYLGIDINTSDPAEWERAFQKLREQKPLVQGYVSDEIFNKMTTGSAAIAPYYAGDYITMKADNPDLGFYYPVEGTNVFVDAMCIPKGGNVELAKLYIDFMLSKDAAIANAEYIGYASPNSQVYNDPDYIDEMGTEAIDILYNTPVDQINANYPHPDPYYHNPDKETQKIINSLWEDLKTENAIEPWIHIVAITIVVAIVTLAVTSVVRRKKRINDYCRYAESVHAPENKKE